MGSIPITRSITQANRVSFSHVHALKETVEGSGSIPPAFGGGEVDLAMSQDSFGIAFSRKF